MGEACVRLHTAGSSLNPRLPCAFARVTNQKAHHGHPQRGYLLLRSGSQGIPSGRSEEPHTEGPEK